MPEALHPRHLRRRVLQLALIAVVVTAVVATLPGLGGIRERFGEVQAAWLSIAVVAELASALSHVVVLRGVFCPSMRWRLSYHLGMSELAADSLLPAGGAGGLALGAWALHRGGMSTQHIARRTVAFFLVTSAANFATVMLAGAGVASGMLPGGASPLLAAVPAVLALVTALFVVLVVPRLLDRVGPAPASRPAPGSLGARLHMLVFQTSATLADGVREAVALLRSGRPTVLAGSLGYMAFDIATLAACFPATGSSVPPLGTLLLGYTLGQLGGLLPIPGGIGATAGGLIGAFALYGAPIAPVAAAVIVYRGFQLGVPALLGAPAFVLLHRSLVRADASMAICEPLAGDGAAA